eukprot:jgi/Ulvmu1/1271/UM109_0069.1
MEGELQVLAGHYVVQIPPAHVHKDVETIIELLSNESAAPSKWIDVALNYLRNGDADLCDKILLKLTQLDEPNALEYDRQKHRAMQIQTKCFRVQMKLDEYVNGESRDPMNLDKISSAANHPLAAAESLYPNDVQVLLTRAQYHATVSDNLIAARGTLQHAKGIGAKTTVGPTLAFAQLLCNSGDYRQALPLLTEALGLAHASPCSNDIRLGIAACYMKLGELDMARMAYDRVLAVDSTCARGYIGLAAVGLMSSSNSGLNRCLDFLQQAHKLDPHLPQLNAVLSQLALVKGDSQTALDHARLAVALATEPATRAYSHCMLARAMHAAGMPLEDTTREYSRSIEAQESPLAHYGMAQMLIRKEQIVNAVTALDKSLRLNNSKDVDSLLLMGKLLPHTTSGMPAQPKLELLKEGAQHHSTNPEVQEMLGDVLAVVDPAQSLKAFKSAMSLRRDTDAIGEAGPSARLMNNTAVLEYRSKQVDAALELMQEAASAMESGIADGVPAQCESTLRFNVARCREAQGDLRAAQQGYEQVLKEHPDYTDCIIRLGYLKYMCGHKADAEALFKQCLEVPGGREDALAVLCMIKQRAESWASAKEYAREVVKTAKTDEAKSFGHVLLGNTYFLSAPHRRPGQKAQDATATQNRFEHLCAAARHFTDALHLQKGNIYAANGLGAVLASLGRLEAARSVFSQLRESAALTSGFIEVPDVWVNLGSLHLARNEAEEAARMYDAALNRFYGKKDSKVLLWLARAYYDNKDIKKSKMALLRAVHLFPHVQSLLFNLALTMQQAAAIVLKKKASQTKATLEELQSAKLELMQAINIFMKLCKLPKKLLQQWTLKPENLKAHVEFCKKAVKDSDEQIRKESDAVASRQKLIADQEEKDRILEEANAIQRQMHEAIEKSKEENRRKELSAYEEQWKNRNEEWKNKIAMDAAAKKGDSSKAAKLRDKQAKAELEQAQMYAAEVEAALNEDEDSSDGEYDEAAMEADERAAKFEEQRLKEAGYNSQDEKGTADVLMDGDDDALPTNKKGKSIKRKLARSGERDVDDGAGLVDFDVPQDLEDDGSLEKRLKGVLESDDD